MDKLYFATSSSGKVKRLQEEMPKNIKLIHLNLDLPEPRTLNLREIAQAKVQFAYNHIKSPVIALDSGFYINCLNEFPATFVNFALGTIGIEGLLTLSKDKPKDCEFRNCLAFYDGSDIHFFESTQKGQISETARGERQQHHLWWSDLDKIFIPEKYTRTLAEMDREEFFGYRQQRKSESFANKFADWISKK
jgi:XTP/dITP diphosphohydrolase